VPAPDTAGGLRLHLNENTAGCPPAVLEALRRLDVHAMATYPDYRETIGAVEALFSVPAGWVQLTNGLDEGLHLVAQAARLTAADFEAIVVEPAFEMYAACIAAAGGRQVTIMPPADLSFPLDGVLGAIGGRTGLIYLCDPNNPSGRPIPDGDVWRIAEAAPRATILVDEAYADFSGRTAIGGALDRHRNVIVGRTFAKAHGLAALRIGALVAHPDALRRLAAVVPPYSVNVAAATALRAAIADREFVARYVADSAASRELVYAWCARRGFACFRSEANFVLVKFGESATEVVEALAASGIHVRDRSRTPGCAGCVRITAGVVADTRRCLGALEEWYASRAR
jgi:histidinol-phosphate aminotransferase